MMRNTSVRLERDATRELDRSYETAARCLREFGPRHEFDILLVGLYCLKYVCDVARSAETASYSSQYRDLNPCDWTLPTDNEWFRVAQYNTQALSRARRSEFELSQRLQVLATHVEEHNASLRGVFTRGLFADLVRLDDAILSPVLAAIPQRHFGALLADVPELFARWVDDTVSRRTQRSSRYSSDIGTHPLLAQLMIGLTIDKGIESILDPACGAGTLLLEAALRHRGDTASGAARHVRILGEDINPQAWALCKIRMLLHGFVAAQIELGDSLSDPHFLEEDGRHLQKVDLVITDPPLGSRVSGVAEDDLWGRFVDAPPTKHASDSAFVQHAIACLAKRGRAALVVSLGLLFRSTDVALRESMLRADLIEAVVRLHARARQGTPTECAVLLLNKDKPADRQGRVLLLDTRPWVPDDKPWHALTNDIVTRTVSLCRNWNVDDARNARIMTREALLNTGTLLDPVAHLEHDRASERLDLTKALPELHGLDIELSKRLRDLDVLLKQATRSV